MDALILQKVVTFYADRIKCTVLYTKLKVSICWAKYLARPINFYKYLQLIILARYDIKNKTEDEHQRYRQWYVSELLWRYVGMSHVNYGLALSVQCNTPQFVLIPQHPLVHVCVLHTPVIIIRIGPLCFAASINAPAASHVFLDELIFISVWVMIVVASAGFKLEHFTFQFDQVHGLLFLASNVETQKRFVRYILFCSQ